MADCKNCGREDRKLDGQCKCEPCKQCPHGHLPNRLWIKGDNGWYSVERI